MSAPHDRPALELARGQAAMLKALFGAWDPAAMAGLVEQPDALRERGLRVYRGNGHALAERALAAAYPVVEQLLHADNFAPLSRAFWHARPPARGDMAQWGEGLADYIASLPQLADEPFLPDVARVEWALHRAATAPDVASDPNSLALLLEREPAQVGLVLAPGARAIASAWPVFSIVDAHLDGATELLTAGERLRAGCAEAAIVWRNGFKPRLRLSMPGEPALLAALLRNASLGEALDASPSLDFQGWLAPAVTQGLIKAIVAR